MSLLFSVALAAAAAAVVAAAIVFVFAGVAFAVAAAAAAAVVYVFDDLNYVKAVNSILLLLLLFIKFYCSLPDIQHDP